MTSTTRQTLTGAALACCAAILLATPTRPLLAEDLTFQFTTTIDASSVGRPANAPLVVTYTFDSDLESSDGFGSYGPIQMTLQVGDESVTATGEFSVNNNWGNGTTDGDGYDVRFNGAHYGGANTVQLFGLDVAFFRFLLVDSDGTMLNSSAIPLSPDFAAQADFQQTEVHLWNPTTDEYIVLSVGEFYNTPPELRTPFSLTLLGDPTPAEQIADLKLSVQALVDAGVSLPARGKSLQALLHLADAAVDRNRAGVAIVSLNAFINQVEAFVRNRRLTPAQGDSLIDAALTIIIDLGG